MCRGLPGGVKEEDVDTGGETFLTESVAQDPGWPNSLCRYQVLVTIVEFVRVALPLCLGKSCHVEGCCWWRGPGIIMIVAHPREETECM